MILFAALKQLAARVWPEPPKREPFVSTLTPEALAMIAPPKPPAVKPKPPPLEGSVEWRMAQEAAMQAHRYCRRCGRPSPTATCERCYLLT